MLVRDDMETPDTRYINIHRVSQRQTAFEKFIIKIFPKELEYVLNPYSFFLILVLSVLPILGIIVYLFIYYLR